MRKIATHFFIPLVVLTLAFCGQDLFGQVTKTYTAPSSVTVDGCGTYCSSLPGVTFATSDFSNGCKISDVNVAVTWAKTDGTCASPGIGNSFHAETNFRIDGPPGNEVLATTNTWTGSATTSSVSTTFDQAASSIPSGTPVSGTFLPNNGNLNNYNNNSPFGTWTLRPGDTGSGDPLCIVGYSVTIAVFSDVTDPTITCPTSVSTTVDPGTCGAVINYNAVTATDNCTASPTINRTSGLASGATFPVGVTTCAFTATDDFSNSSNCSFTVTVTDNENPTANCQNTTVYLNSSGNVTVTPNDIDNNSSDNCAITTSSVSPANFNCTSTGTNTVVLSVSDLAGNSASCSSTVTVTDSIAPTASCSTATVYIGSGGTATITGADINAGSSDNCSIATQIASPSSFGCSSTGSQSVSLTVTDPTGNSRTCVTTVTVQDTATPSLNNCPTDTTLTITDGNCTPTVGWTAPTWTDNCSAFVTTTDTSGSTFTQGVTKVTYYVTDSSLNIDSCSFNVTVSIAPLGVNLSSTSDNCGNQIACNGGTTWIKATTTGGCASYNFNWSTGASTDSIGGLSAGTYVITVYDGLGDSIVDSITLMEPPLLTGTTTGTSDLCPGDNTGTVDLTASGGCGPLTYNWSSGDTTEDLSGLASGTYSVTITDANGCTGSASHTIIANPGVTVTVALNGTLDSLIASVSGGTPNFSYQWYLSGSPIGGATSSTYGPSSNGQYSVQVTDDNGCVSSDTISFIVGNEPMLRDNRFQLYPNPASSEVNIITDKAINEPVRIVLVDLSGKIVRDVNMDRLDSKYTLDLRNLSTGMYILRVDGKDGMLHRARLVVE